MVILDVRTPEEYQAGHLAGAQNIDFLAPGFEQEVARLDASAVYLLYCASGNRSGKAFAAMAGKALPNLYNSKAGFNELKSAGIPTE